MIETVKIPDSENVKGVDYGAKQLIKKIDISKKHIEWFLFPYTQLGNFAFTVMVSLFRNLINKFIVPRL